MRSDIFTCSDQRVVGSVDGVAASIPMEPDVGLDGRRTRRCGRKSSKIKDGMLEMASSTSCFKLAICCWNSGIAYASLFSGAN